MTNSSFRFEQPEDSPGFLLWQTTIIWQRLIKQALQAYDISHPQFIIMAILLWANEVKKTPTQSFISKQSKLDKMTVSQAIKKLVAKSLLKRQESKQDTRAKLISLTIEGEKLIQTLLPIIESIDDNFFIDDKKNNLNQFNKYLLQLLKKYN